jgi:erythronate-4-phosphate dehydrogenase
MLSASRSAPPVRALADENIPFARAALETLGHMSSVDGRALRPADVAAADVLWVRSVTPVDPALLAEARRLQFVGSATAGTDHVDRAFLQERGIAFAHAPGSNASSVADYVVAALLSVAARRAEPLRGRTAAVVGCGAVGSRVARRLGALGMSVLKNDPPRADEAERAGRDHDFRPLAEVLAAADLVTLHVPLDSEGPHATHSLIGEEALAAMPEGAWLVNTSRGAVVEGVALERALKRDHVGAAVLDVWPGEPTPDPALVRQADVATPHIAGYAFDGKVRGTEMLYRALCEHLDAPPRWRAEDVLAAEGDAFHLDAPDSSLGEAAWLDALARQMYDVRADDRRLRAALEGPAEGRAAAFTALRRDYPRRRAFSRYRIAAGAVPPARRTAVAEGLGVDVAP